MRSVYEFSAANLTFSITDFEWMGRIVKGLWSLGEFAFRELLVFFEKIDTRNVKETTSFVININVSLIN